jgi:IclR family transcriptional regulator, pca regulon regulatory protein
MARVKAKQRFARREAMGGLAKGLAVIRAFSREHAALTLSEIAARARMPPATARRCILTLEELNYVMRKGRSFFLRPKVLELGAAYIESMDIDRLTQTHLEELARVTGDSAAVSVLDGNDIVYVARASVRTLLRLEAHVGSRFPAHVTSMGRILLSGLSTERLGRYFNTQEFVALTDRTVTDRRKVRQLIVACRRAGYSAVEDELAYGVVAVAVPIFDLQGQIVAALNSSSHSKRISKAKLVRERLPILRKAGQEISAEIARVPGLSLNALR